MKAVCIAFMFCLWQSISYAEVFYMSDPGQGNHQQGDYTSLREAFEAMQGGDTLVIRDGVYTGEDNRITQGDIYPPSGAPGSYTTIRAENPGCVLFDGEGEYAVLWMDGYVYDDPDVPDGRLSYVQFEGITWGNCRDYQDREEQTSGFSAVQVYGVHHWKFIRCGAYDGGYGNCAAFDIMYSDHVLLEECYAWGGGRYKFAMYRSDHMILRRCVARQDKVESRHEGNLAGEPQAIYTVYWSHDVEVQNCIAIDSDHPEFWGPTEEIGGAFFCPQYSYNVWWRGCIALNNAMCGGIVSWEDNNIHFENVVCWDATNGISNSSELEPFPNMVVDHCVIGCIERPDGTGTDDEVAGVDGWAGVERVTNSIIYNIQGTGLTYIEDSDYNCIYECDEPAYDTSLGEHDIINEVDPIDGDPGNGIAALQCLLEIEQGSDLAGKASDGGDIGATIVERIGVSGTLYGEAGYRDYTGISLWPFPYEGTIRTAMRNYSYSDSGEGTLTGDRGFCANGQTLTKYIQEYISAPGGVVGDTIPPVAVTDLSAATGTAGNAIDLGWTAPGDDGNTGTASVYIIRYNTVPITESNWDGSSDVTGEPIPGPAGTAESMTVTMPHPGVVYYFAIKTQDEVPNTSAISNSPYARSSIQLYTGWNLVAFISSNAMSIAQAMSCISNDYTSIWRYDAPTATWLKYIVGGPDFLNNLDEMVPAYGYWIYTVRDCVWNFGGSSGMSPPAMAMWKPPFILYGKITQHGRAVTFSDGSEVSLKVGNVEAGSYVLGSNPRYKDYYVLEIPVDGCFREGDVARIYVDRTLADIGPVTLGGIGIVRRHDISYTRVPPSTRLLQNYPNPFNPDTWIPYQLREDAHVVIRVYTLTGQPVRTLNVGYRAAGFYTSKEQAAYWDGKNEGGEDVASDVYFYSIKAGDFTANRKMVLRK
jgi:hypothetical protein